MEKCDAQSPYNLGLQKPIMPLYADLRICTAIVKFSFPSLIIIIFFYSLHTHSLFDVISLTEFIIIIILPNTFALFYNI